MDDFDNLNSKTDSDLRQIAVAFGDFTAEEAEKKTRDELLMAITGAKDIGDITTVDLTEELVPVKAPAIPEPMKTTENTKSLDELIVDVGRTARFETNELADAMLKAEKEEEKKVAKKEAAAEGLTEEPKAEKKSAAKAEKKPAKRTKKTEAKAEEPAKEKAEVTAEDPAEKASEESGKAEKKASKPRKTRASKKKEAAPAEEVKAEEPTPIEAAVAEASVAEDTGKRYDHEDHKLTCKEDAEHAEQVSVIGIG